PQAVTGQHRCRCSPWTEEVAAAAKPHRTHPSRLHQSGPEPRTPLCTADKRLAVPPNRYRPESCRRTTDMEEAQPAWKTVGWAAPTIVTFSRYTTHSPAQIRPIPSQPSAADGRQSRNPDHAKTVLRAHPASSTNRQRARPSWKENQRVLPPPPSAPRPARGAHRHSPAGSSRRAPGPLPSG